ncbi:Cerato-platanin [Irpex rosettiformis]|uniref:Cerato-platanin n=1 Tax=Irpex rosettiformis TaxID=378272 RepID=A0ACB8UHA3_9APHY|nr:Cerato-platanin [Irpex rosettiformis]
MQFTFSAILAVLSIAAVGQSVSVSWDNTYDDAGASLSSVACSDGSNGLMMKGFSTFGSLPNFPRIGGAPAVGGWDSAACGTCWQLTYNGKSINVLAVDVGRDGFNLSQEAMDELTNGQAVQLGRVDASVNQVDASACGL